MYLYAPIVSARTNERTNERFEYNKTEMPLIAHTRRALGFVCSFLKLAFARTNPTSFIYFVIVYYSRRYRTVDIKQLQA